MGCLTGVAFFFVFFFAEDEDDEDADAAPPVDDDDADAFVEDFTAPLAFLLALEGGKGVETTALAADEDEC